MESANYRRGNGRRCNNDAIISQDPMASPPPLLQDRCVLCKRKVAASQITAITAAYLSDGGHGDGGTVNPSTHPCVSKAAMVVPLLPPHLSSLLQRLNPSSTTTTRQTGINDNDKDHSICCKVCGDKVANVGSLIDSIKQQVRDLRGSSAVARTTSQEKFENELRSSGASGQVISSTLKFINGLHSDSDGDLTVAMETGKSISGGNSNEKLEDFIKLEPEDATDFQEDMESPALEEDDLYEPEMEENSEEEAPSKKRKTSPSPRQRSGKKPPASTSKKTKVSKSDDSSIPPDDDGKILCGLDGCDKSFVSRSNLFHHQRKVHPGAVDPRKEAGRPQLCDMCGGKFPLSEILTHVQSHVGDYAMPCPFTPDCPFVASNPNSFRIHTANKRGTCGQAFRAQNKKKDYPCESCDFRTEYPHRITAHLRRHHERSSQKDFRCPVANCDATFCVRQSVWHHLEAHSINTVANQRCKQCPKSFRVGPEMESHLRSAHSAQEILKCEQCPFLFTSHVRLLEHLHIHRHAGIQCAICPQEDPRPTYTNHHDLRKHCRALHQVDVPQFMCEHCNRVFKKKSHWTYHVKISHANSDDSNSKQQKTRTKRYPCDICFEPVVDFSSEAALINHKISLHGAEPFTCKTCGMTFKVQKFFSRHLKEHQGLDFKYACDVDGCGKVFKDCQKMKGHRARVHFGGEAEKMHVCDTCGKSFSNGTYLRRHKAAVHVGIRGYVCELCGKDFSEGRKLNKHKEWHYGRVKKKKGRKPNTKQN